MARVTSAQKAQIVALVNQGMKQKDIASQLGISFKRISYYAVKNRKENSDLSPQQRAWVTRRATEEQAYFNSLTPGKKAAYTKRLKKGLDPRVSAAKPKVAKAKEAKTKEAKTKVTKTRQPKKPEVVFEIIDLNGAIIKIQPSLLPKLHIHPNGNEITIAETTANGRPKKN